MTNQSLKIIICFSGIGCFLAPLGHSPVSAENIAVDETELFTGASMLNARNGWSTTPALTIGQTINGISGNYQMIGIPDGLDAYTRDGNIVRVLMNHEVTQSQGYAYTLGNGTSLIGARISYIDFDKPTRQILDAGIAYDKVYDRSYNLVTQPSQVNELGETEEGYSSYGLSRLCAANLIPALQFGNGTRGLANTIFFTNEESKPPNHPHGGSFWALDVDNQTLWALPELGRGCWECLTELDTGTTSHVAFLMGDDSAGAPLYLYMGEKEGVGDGSFLDNNGLAKGKIYFWKADDGTVDPSGFKGTGASKQGTFVEISARDESKAGIDGHDGLGYKDVVTLQNEAETAGGFNFSRPEDVATNPDNGSQAVFASTGFGSLFADDDWGTTYLLNANFSNYADGNVTATLTILYDGDDVDKQDYGIRSPDNLEWADDGMIYIQEDKATKVNIFGANEEEASIWMLDPDTSIPTRIAQIDRSVVEPVGTSDSGEGTIGTWESSGITDVTSLFGHSGTLLIGNVQAHGIKDGYIGSSNLVQGGQFFFLEAIEPSIIHHPKLVNAISLGNNWYKDSHIGQVYSTDETNWLYQQELGYIYPYENSNWFYSANTGLGFLYMDASNITTETVAESIAMKGFVYSTGTLRWIYLKSYEAHNQIITFYYDTISGAWTLLSAN